MVSLRQILAGLAIVPAALVSAAPVDERCDCDDKPAPKVFIISMVFLQPSAAYNPILIRDSSLPKEKYGGESPTSISSPTTSLSQACRLSSHMSTAPRTTKSAN